MNGPDFKLTEAEIHSATWKRISEHFQERLADHRRNNDGDLDPISTAKLRGRTKEVLYLLGLAEREPPAPVADHDE